MRKISLGDARETGSVTAGKANAGFTLVELLVVLAVAAAALAVVAPNFSSGKSNIELKSAAYDTSSALRYVRGRAITEGREAEFVLDVGNHIYRVSGRSKAYSLPENVAITLDTAETEIKGEGVGAIRFFPDGSSTGGRITIEGGGLKRIVDVNWVTGLVATRAE
ncbi:MAG: GspH/FimT family protein [Pseudomonadota bacterium]